MAKKRVLIISTGAGTGHIRAADALEKTFRQHSDVGEVVHLDALNYTNQLFSDFYSKFYTTLVESAPNFLGWWYKQSDEPWKTDPMRLALDRLNTVPLVKFIRGFDPDITVCTHFMPAGIISHLMSKKELQTQLSIVVTDFDFHAMWLSRHFHRYFVAIEETKAHLDTLGLPPERITVSGIPVDPDFGKPIDRARIRTEFGLDPDKTTILLSAGAVGLGYAEFIVERLQTLRNDVQTIVLCGRSADLRARIAEMTASSKLKFQVYGFVTRMHELMGASDLFIGKPGGLTTAEALAVGLPMVIVAPIPGQEERNSDHLLEEGIAIKCNEMTTLPFKIDRLLDEPGRLAQMRENTRRLAKPNAAWTIVNTLMGDKLPPIRISKEEVEAIAAVVTREGS
ncbi:MAG TPA: glycosyltransferase [Chthoniobacterales bacterium]